MEFLVAAGKIALGSLAVQQILNQLIQQPVCLICYESKVKELDQYIEYLQDKRERVQRRVDDEKRKGKEIATDVENWLKKVKDIITEHEDFLKDERHAYAGCSKGHLPKPGIRYCLGREAYRMAREVDKLCKTLKFDGVSYGLGPLSVEAVFSDIGLETFKSRNKVMEDIMEALKDSTVRMIGVHGLGGVGKTTLVKRVASKALKDKMFNEVVIVNVTKNPDIRKIQGQLADMLGLRLEEESEIGRASRLRERLNEGKEKTLVILDDLWAGIDLKNLGIPFDDDDYLSQKTIKDGGMLNVDLTKKAKSSGDHRMCKILLTSRRKEVLDVKEKIIFVDVLKEKEAEMLFKKVARVAEKLPDFEPLAAKICKKCAGLPMAVVTIGRSLRNKNYFEWNDALGQLERKEFTGVGESVEFSTKLSFDNLGSEELKSTFLLCAQMGHHPLIMDLMKYCIGLGIFEGFLTIRESRDRIHTLIEKLKDSSLLIDSYSSDRFNMHGMIRDVALSLASKERNAFIKRNEKLDEWPHNSELESYGAISLHNCDINEKLPESPNCPRLKIFHVDNIDPCLEIPHSFFDRMREIRVLTLIGVDLSSFPNSIGGLTNLRMLCLEQCMLGDISIIGNLKKLRILSLSGSNIETLPTKLGQLDKLQLFDISNCSKLRVIQPNVISSMNSLEELYMRNSLKWEVEGNQSENAVLAELSHLHQLKILDVCIPNVAIFPQKLFLDKLDSYKIVVGDFKTLAMKDFKMPDKYETSRALAVQIKESTDIHSQKGIIMLFRRVEKLLLGELKNVQNIFYQLNLEGFPCLKHFSIVNNSNVECIIDSKDLSDPQDAFPLLESLCLYKLENMQRICYSKLRGKSFCKLKVIKIKLCSGLKNIFSPSMVLLLTELETIEVFECDSIEKVVGKEEQDNDVKDDKIEFPKLRILTLQTLPAFTGVYTNERGVNTPDCLFSDQVEIRNLESLELSSINIQKIWSGGSSPRFCFRSLIKLDVKDCKGLKYLLSFSVARSLENLKSMTVSGCDMMEEIFLSEGTSMHESKKVRLLPKLEEIQLTNMEILTRIWPVHVSLHSILNLSSLVIDNCKKLGTVFPSRMVGRFCSLVRLKIVHCYLVQEIFDLKDAPQTGGGNETHLQFFHIRALPNLKHVWNRDPEGILNFKSLQRIEVFRCRDLKYLFPVSVAKGLRELDCLWVIGCLKMEGIVGGEEPYADSIILEFPEVTAVGLEVLPELKNFYRGRHSLKWPKLKTLVVHRCEKLEVFKTETANPEVQAIFLPEEVISKLEIMVIGLKEAERLKHQIRCHLMHHLIDLRLCSWKSVDILYWFLHRSPNLEKLTLFTCSFKELLPSGCLQAQERIGTVVQLKYLVLVDLLVLENIGFERDPVLQRLELLEINGCPRLINLAPSSVTFTHLTSLGVYRCRGLIKLMAFSTAKSLVHLTFMGVVECKLLEEVVAEQGNEEETKDANNAIVFSKLMTLELVSLRNLTSFCSSKIQAFKFPSLEKLIVRECPMMNIFSEQVTTAPNLQVFIGEEEEGKCHWEGDLNATIQKACTDLVSFEYFEQLELSNYPQLEQIWHGKITPPQNCFRNLKTLVVENCEFLSDVIPYNLHVYLKNLEELQVRNCSSVEVIFDINDRKMEKTQKNSFHLKKLTLILSFENIQEVEIADCESLKTLFPAASVAKSLSKLETLRIRNCGALVEIVGKAETSTEGAIEKFRFQHLTTVALILLPELMCFYPGRMKLECPMLKLLDFCHCGKLEIFASESPRNQEAYEQSLFSDPKVTSCLELLSLNKKEAMMLCNGDIPVDPVNKLKCLQLHCFHNVTQEEELPFRILHKLPSIKCLAVACSDFQEIFPQRLAVELAQIRELRLEFLSNLNFIGLENPGMDPLRENLENLDVMGCPCLTKLVQSAVCFSNLKELRITGCHGLVYLFTTSTARSLVQLKIVIVQKCKSIKKIVAKEENDLTQDNTTFGQLSVLCLYYLSSLTCFYSGSSSTMEFPYLEHVIIAQCPNMKIFSQGALSTPLLVAIQTSPNKWDLQWEGDLNTTVEKLFEKKAERGTLMMQ